MTFAAIAHWTLVNSDTFLFQRIVIFGVLQLPEANIGLLVSRSIKQAAPLHKFLHERVNFMIDLFGLQYGIRAGLPPLDFSVLAERMVLSLLARRLFDSSNCSQHRLQILFRFLRHPAWHGQPRHCHLLSSAQRNRAAEGHRAPPHILDQTLAIECERKLKLESKN